MLSVNSSWSHRVVANLILNAAKRYAQNRHHQATIYSTITNNRRNHHHHHGQKGRHVVQSSINNTKQSLLATEYYNNFQNYCQMINHSKSIARRSVLIDLCDHEGIDLSSDYPYIDKVYSIDMKYNSDISRLSLIEFKSEADAEAVSRNALSHVGVLAVPLKILKYKPRGREKPVIETADLPLEHIKLSNKLVQSDDIHSYHDFISRNMISLVALKLKFITLVNIERVICSGMFEEYELMPFGSSVIDFGSDFGDLDLLMTRKVDHADYSRRNLTGHRSRSSTVSESSGLAKNLAHLGNSSNKKIETLHLVFELFGKVLRDFLPLTDARTVLPLVHAKVPIIKFTTQVPHTDCDLSFDLGLNPHEEETLNKTISGVFMSHVLYTLCRSNNLIAPVIVYLRNYAKLTATSGKGSTAKFTNFQLLSLILFYLQQVSLTPADQSTKKRPKYYSLTYVSSQIKCASKARAIVPPFKYLLEENFYPQTSHSVVEYTKDELEKLVPLVVEEFMRFYSIYDFAMYSLNLYNSKIELKPDNSPIYVVNPTNCSENVCYNVTSKGLDRFVKQLRMTVKNLEDEEPGHDSILSIMKSLLSSQGQSRISAPRPTPYTSTMIRDMFET